MRSDNKTGAEVLMRTEGGEGEVNRLPIYRQKKWLSPLPGALARAFTPVTYFFPTVPTGSGELSNS